MTAPLPRLYSVADVAAALGVTERYVRDKCRRRDWPHRRLARGQVAFTDADYRRVLELCEAPAESGPSTGLSFAPRSVRPTRGSAA